MGWYLSKSVISGIVGIFCGFLLSIYLNTASLAAGSIYRMPTISSPTPSIAAGGLPSPTAAGAVNLEKFSASGILVLSQPKVGQSYWTLVYMESGQSVNISLLFSADSLCDTGQNNRICVTEEFVNGMKAKVVGIGKGKSVEVLLLSAL